MAFRIMKQEYTGPIWENGAVAPALWELLNQTDQLIEIYSGELDCQIVIGVPHHAAPGVELIAEDWQDPAKDSPGRAADETTGLTGLAIFQALKDNHLACKLVVAAHATDHDPNKTPGCPYWESIFSPPHPALLLELHGAGKTRRYDLELSAGQNRMTRPLCAGRHIIRSLDHPFTLAAQETPGESQGKLLKGVFETACRLQNPALKTLSLQSAETMGIQALHLELKPGFRQPDPAYSAGPYPSQSAWSLAKALAHALRDYLTVQPEVRISAADLGLNAKALLVDPDFAYQESFLEATHEATLEEMNLNPDLRILTLSGISYYIQSNVEARRQNCLKVGEMPFEVLWLVEAGEFIGRIEFFHWMDEDHRSFDGQVDYWIRPSKRCQGYGTLILRMALERFRQVGMREVLVTCFSDNLPSRKIIEANGGVYESEVPDNSSATGWRRRYWIAL